MTYTATVHQPGDVIHTAGRDGRIRVWSVTADGSPSAVEQEPTPAPVDLPAPDLPAADDDDELVTYADLARACDVAIQSIEGRMSAGGWDAMIAAELVTETLAYVDKTVDNVADLPTDLPWSNAEVVRMLDDVRSLLITGRVVPHGG